MSYAKYLENIDIDILDTIDKTFELHLGDETFQICLISREDAEQFIFTNKNTAIIRYTSKHSIKHCATKHKRPDIIEKMNETLKLVQSEIEDEKESDFETARRILIEFYKDNLLPMLTISFYSSVGTISEGRRVPPGIRHVQVFSFDQFHTTIESIKNLGPTILYGEDKPLMEIRKIPGNNVNAYTITRKIPEASIKDCLVPGS